MTEVKVCSICLEEMTGLFNKVITSCGHEFHCLCLMTNVAHKRYRCPYCRTPLMTRRTPLMTHTIQPADLDQEERYEAELREREMYRSFRLFHARIYAEYNEDEELGYYDIFDWGDTDDDMDEDWYDDMYSVPNRTH
jgi:hypothetical protein